MTDKILYFIMVPMVYLAVGWFFVGSIIKIAGIIKAPGLPHTLRIFPEKEVRAPRLAAVVDAFTMPTVRIHRPLLWFFLIVYNI